MMVSPPPTTTTSSSSSSSSNSCCSSLDKKVGAQQERPNYTSMAIPPMNEKNLDVKTARMPARAKSGSSTSTTGDSQTHKRLRDKETAWEGTLWQQHYRRPEERLREAFHGCYRNHNSSRPLFVSIAAHGDGEASRFARRVLVPYTAHDRAEGVEETAAIFVMGTYQSPQLATTTTTSTVQIFPGNIPYGGLLQAMTQCVRSLVRKDNTKFNSGSTTAPKEDDKKKMSELKTCLERDLCRQDKSILMRMIPDLEDLLGGVEEKPPTTGREDQSESQQQHEIYRYIGFQSAFGKLLQAISKFYPLVMVLDNLQWMDDSSKEWLASIIITTTQDTGGRLLIIGSYDDEVMLPEERQMPLFAKLGISLEGDNKDCSIHISLPRVTKEQIDTYLWDSFRLEAESRLLLVDLMLQQTNGAVFRMMDFMKWILRDTQLLQPNLASWSEGWILLLEDSSSTTRASTSLSTSSKQLLAIPEKVNGFLEHRLAGLSRIEVEILQVTACMGRTVSRKELETIVGTEVIGLQTPVAKGLLIQSDHDELLIGLADQLQPIVLQTITVTRRAEFERMIGRKLWTSLDTHKKLDGNVLRVISHLYKGRSLIEDDDERVEVATICLQAGSKATEVSAFSAAAHYFKFGIDILPKDHWGKPKSYHLAMSLYSAAAEISMCGDAADFSEVERLHGIIVQKARSEEERIHAESTRMYTLSLQGRHQECIELGKRLLKSMNVTFPKRLSTLHLLPDMIAVSKLLKGKSDNDIINMKMIENKKELQILQVLAHMMIPCIISDKLLCPFVLIKQTKLAMKYGMSVFASTAFSGYGMFCISATGDTQQAYRFEKLALTLLERFGVNVYLPRIFAGYHGCVRSFTRSPLESLEPLLHANKVGNALGDAEYACLCANLFGHLVLEGGFPMAMGDRYDPMFHAMLACPERRALALPAIPAMDYCARLKGESQDPLSSKGVYTDLDELYQEADAIGSVQTQLEIKLAWMRLGYIFGNNRLAEKHCFSRRDFQDMAPTIAITGAHFIVTLVCLQAAKEGRRRWRNLRMARRSYRKFKTFAADAPSHNLDRKALLEAELASVSGKHDKACEKYKLAILYTEDSKSVMVRAFAYERMGRHLLDNQDVQAAGNCFRDASDAYAEWGALAKVTHIRRELETLLEGN